MANRRRALRSALSTLALAGTLGLTACGAGTSGPEAQGTPSAGASGTPAPDARPTPASSTGPARNLPKPELPAAAKENTEAGFKAFTQYWFDTVTYALETGDTGPLKAVSKADCKICNGYLRRADQVATGNGWNIGPRWTVEDFTSTLKLDPLGQAVGYFLIRESAASKYASNGSMTESQAPISDDEPKAIYAVHDGHRWVTSQAGNA